MNYEWQTPFRLALELLAFLVGWTLVAFIVFFIVAVSLGLLRGTKQLLKKDKPKTEEKTDERDNLGQPMLGVVGPPDNLNALELKKLFERE